MSPQRKCSKCLRFKAMANFLKDKQRPQGRGYVCTKCRAYGPYPQKYVRTKMLRQGFGWCAGCRSWLSVADLRRGRCRPCINRYYRTYYASTPALRERVMASDKIRKRGVASVPKEARERLMEQFSGLCAYCSGAPATSFDHIVPVRLGGITEPCNIVPACQSCNCRKRAMPAWAWIDSVKGTANPAILDVIALAHASPAIPTGNHA